MPPKLITVAIPTYEMHGHGAEFLRFSFDKLVGQTYKNFNVVISDHSKDNAIQKLCGEYQGRLDITYIRNADKHGNSPANVNNAIRHARGTLIKILFQDDFLYHDRALEDIANAFDLEKDYWLITACGSSTDGKDFFRPFHPFYNDKIQFGKNTISSPSVLTIKNVEPLLFDEKLIWRMDVDYYARCFQKFGLPKILDSVNVINRVHPGQITHTRTNQNEQEKEFIYILKKYEVRNWRWQLFLYRLRRSTNWLKRKTKKLAGHIL